MDPRHLQKILNRLIAQLQRETHYALKKLGTRIRLWERGIFTSIKMVYIFNSNFI